MQAVPDKLKHWENWLGLIFPGWLSLNIGFWIVLLPLRHWARWSWCSRSELILTGVLWALLDVPYLLRLRFVVRNDLKPFAFEAAVAVQPRGFLLRPVIAVWWLGHFAIPFWLVVVLAHAPIPHQRHPMALHFVIMFMWGLTANGFLMLAVCSCTSSERIQQIAWRFRILTDVALATVVLVVR
jgi:hypothetical protein